MKLTVDNKEYIVTENGTMFTTPSFNSAISVSKVHEFKYRVDSDIYGVASVSFTSLVAAFREALLISKRFK